MPATDALQDLANSLEPYLGGTDSDAIHVDVADEITQITLKAAPLIDDVAVIEDTADSAAKKSITLGTLAKMPGQVTALTAATPVAADLLAFEDASDALAMKKTMIGALPITQSQVSSVVAQPAADAAFEIDATIDGVQLVITAAGNIAITTNANVFPGQKVNLFALSVAGGGSYTLALDVGTLTLNATSESAVVQRNAGDTAWVCVGLSGATIV